LFRPRFSWMLLLLAGTLALMPQGQARPQHSEITIHVHKSGLFSGFAHDHTVTAPIAQGKLDTKAMVVEITVAAKQMKVVDPDVSEKDRAEVQATMLGPKVLDAEKFPEIRFRSSHAEQISSQHYRVTGKLELHGASRDLSFEVSGDTEGQYLGKVKLKQTDFGIQPISLGGGTIKVKDELEIEFHVFAGDLAQGNQR
jgi:polyisoprenoid-binding protein YceI